MKKIMILDDDPETIELLTRILQKNYEVIVIEHLQDLLEEKVNVRPDLIIVDHFMNNEEAQTIMGRLKENPLLKGTPIVIYSAYEKLDQLCELINAAGYIRKPSGITEIRDYLHRLLESK